MPLKNEPFMYRFAFSVTVAVACLVGTWLGINIGDRDPPTTTYEAAVITPRVRPGDDLRIKYTVRRHRACRTYMDRFIYDGENQRHILDDVDFGPGLRLGEESYVVVVKTPLDAAPGRARYTVFSSFVCNPLHYVWPIVGSPRDIPFDIVP